MHPKHAQRIPPAPARRPAVPVFLALAFHMALLLNMALHEVVGHAAAALLVGGSVHGVFISPAVSTAYVWAGDAGFGWKTVAMLAAGSAVNLLSGLAAWALAGRVRGFAARVFLWVFAVTSLVLATIYIGVEPLLGWLTHTAFGDFTHIFAALGLSPLWPALVAIPAGVWIMARGLRWAQEIVQVYLAPGHPPGPFRSFWQLIWPGYVLFFAYLAALLPWLDSYVALYAAVVGFVVVVAYTGLAAVLLAACGRRAPGRAGQATPAALARRPAIRGLARWNATALLVAVACPLIFGPTQSLAWGIKLQDPPREAFFNVHQETAIRVTLGPDGAAQLRLSVRPTPRDRRSRLQWQMAQGALEAGPTREAAEGYAALVAQNVLGASGAAAVEQVRRAGDAWEIEGTLAGLRPGELRVSVTGGAVGYITRVEVEGPGLQLIGVEPAGTTVAILGSQAVWTETPGAPRGVTLHLRWEV